MASEVLGLDTEYVVCNLCGADDASPWGYKDGIHIVRCRRCGLIYSNPRPTQEELTRYYNKEYFEEVSYETDPKRLAMYRMEIATMKKTVPMKGRFLDVGCAYGRFLSLLPDNVEKFGIEFSREAAEHGRHLYGLNIAVGKLSQSSFEDRSFDIIHTRSVIEHMEDPFRDLSTAHRLLKRDGWMIVSNTPNIGSPCGRFYGQDFRLVFPIEHIYYFSTQTLSEMLRKAGFEPVHTFYPYWGTPYASVAKDAAAFLWNKLTGKQSPPFWHSVMAIYARKVEA